MNALAAWTSKLSCSLSSVATRCQATSWRQAPIPRCAVGAKPDEFPGRPASSFIGWPATLGSSGWWGQQQIRGSKYLSKSARKRLVLTTKRARKGFYKGKGSTKEGFLTSKGKFVVDPLRRLQLVVPDLTNFKLKPYIASTVPKYPPEEQHNPIPR